MPRSEAITQASVEDAEYRLEQALAAVRTGRWVSAMDYAIEAGEVLQAMLERHKREAATR